MDKTELGETDRKFREQAITGFKSDVSDMICNCDFTIQELKKIMKTEMLEIREHAKQMLANTSSYHRFKQYVEGIWK